MNPNPPLDLEPRLPTRRNPDEDPHSPIAVASRLPPAEPAALRTPSWRTLRRLMQGAMVCAVLSILLCTVAWFAAGMWVRSTTRAALPQIDGTLAVSGLSSSVTVLRDAHGVPHIQAGSVDDLVFAQGFVTTQDRMFQMDLLRRHAAGELAEVLGSSMLAHDRLQRTLQIRAAADRAVAVLPQDQLHLLEVYARGVNAAMAQQHEHLPIEFHLLGYRPRPWTPRDSLLVSLAMFQDLTNAYPTKLAREALTAHLPAELVPDLYPVGSWRDHPPTTPEPDLTLPGPPIEQVPLDESQASFHMPFSLPGMPRPDCQECVPGSNNWVVSGVHTASGKPLLANDMHLLHSLPGIWYEADLSANTSGEPLHVAGVSIPGLPLIVVGHNDHVAWGFTNLGADVQDLYIEKTQGSGAAEQFEGTDGSWQPVVSLAETIRVKHAQDVPLTVQATKHGETLTPILTPLFKSETRTLALRWTLYDPAVLQLPVLALAKAHDWASFTEAFSRFGGPAQNVVYADDQGHIGYHAVGRIPLRGPAVASAPTVPSDIASPVAARDPNESPDLSAAPSPIAGTDVQAAPTPLAPQESGPLSPVPVAASAAREWSGYIPFERLPQAFDPQGGVIATANARVVPDDYGYPVTLNWAAPYRNERIWHVLAGSKGLKPADMLSIQTDVYSDFDHVLAQRLAYAIDHSALLAGDRYSAGRKRMLRQAADQLRSWNGRMTVESSAAAIVSSVHAALWPMLLKSHGNTLNDLYVWGEKDYALEQILMHTPARWLPSGVKDWNDFLASVVDQALWDAKAPGDLARWRYGAIHTVDIEHPVFAQSGLLRKLMRVPTGTGEQAQSGDGTTVKQVGHVFGPSERFTAAVGDWDQSTLNVVSGQSGNPMSPWFLDQFHAWLRGSTFAFAFSQGAVEGAAAHTLRLVPK